MAPARGPGRGEVRVRAPPAGRSRPWAWPPGWESRSRWPVRRPAGAPERAQGERWPAAGLDPTSLSGVESVQPEAARWPPAAELWARRPRSSGAWRGRPASDPRSGPPALRSVAARLETSQARVGPARRTPAGVEVPQGEVEGRTAVAPAAARSAGTSPSAGKARRRTPAREPESGPGRVAGPMGRRAAVAKAPAGRSPWAGTA